MGDEALSVGHVEYGKDVVSSGGVTNDLGRLCDSLKGLMDRVVDVGHCGKSK